jgi:hypothetical protein
LAVGPAIPASVNQVDLEVSPVLGFASSAGFQIQITEADFYW